MLKLFNPSAMTASKIIVLFLSGLIWLSPHVSFGQQSDRLHVESNRLFDSEETVEIRLEGDIETLLNDRGEDPSYHLFKLHVENPDSKESLDLRVKVRGNFRRLKKNCDTPPLKFNFKKHEVPEASLFAGQPELKLVVPCRGEEYVIREYLVYKLYNLFTDYSFNVRLVRFTFHDGGRGELSDPQYGFLIEDKETLANRIEASLFERLNCRPEIVDQEAFFRMSVFAYMIGNTDWSIQFLHNTKLYFMNSEKVFISVPYDFDLVGLVSSPYARPATALNLRSVRERVYRGYCLEDLNLINPTFSQFRELRPEIYRTIRENPLLDEDYIEFATEYLDDFYDTLDNRKKRSRAFRYPCNRNGTGNVVIRGLNEG